MAEAALAAPPAAYADAPANANRWLVAVAVALGALLEIVDTSIVNVALTEMQNSLGATLTQVSWVVSSYAIANVIILPLTAWLGHRFGKKRYFVFSLIAFTAASVLCGMAHSLPMLIVARVLQGLGGGGLLAKAQSILFETFPKHEQAMAQGFFSAIVIAGPTIGPTLGGYIVTNIDWRWIFFINVPLGIAAVLMCLAFLPPDVAGERQRGGVDWLAIALLAAGVGSLQTVLEEGHAEEWFDSPFILALSAIAAVSLALFIHRELSSKSPIVDLRVLRHRSLWAGSLLSAVIGMGLYGTLFAVPIFAQSLLGYTSQQTGLLLLPGALVSALSMPLVARLVSRFDPRVLIVTGGLILLAALFQLHQLTPMTGADDLFWPLIIRSFGTTLMFLPLSMATLGPLPRNDIAAATGLYSLTRQLGGSVGVAVLTTVLADRQAFHRAVLVSDMGASDPRTLERIAAYASGFVAKGFDAADARNKALHILDGIVNLQAAVMSFNDTFWVTAVLVIATLPLVFLLGKGRGGPVSAGH